MAKPDRVLFRQDRIRKPVLPGQKVPLTLSAWERELILQHTFADDELTAPLRLVPTTSKTPVYSFTLDDLEELVGYVAAEANHAQDKKLQKELGRLFARMETTLQSYTDEGNGPTD
jgi:hypothetical protein